MAKKVAVIVRDRQHEALRMAVGLTIGDNAVSVFIMDRKLPADDLIDLNLQALGDMGARVFSNVPENVTGRGCELMTTGEIARALVEFDTVIPY